MTAKRKTFESYTSLNPRGCKTRWLGSAKYRWRSYSNLYKQRTLWVSKISKLGNGFLVFVVCLILLRSLEYSYHTFLSKWDHKLHMQRTTKENFRICKFPRWNHDRKTVSEFMFFKKKNWSMSSGSDNLSALCENLAQANSTWVAGTWTLHLKDIHEQLVSQLFEDWM